jgi:hypothetical protein
MNSLRNGCVTNKQAALEAFLAEQPLSAMFDLEAGPALFRRVPDLPE